MKEKLIVGDSIDEEVEAFDAAGNEYTGADGWSAKFVFNPREAGSGVKFEIGCSWTGDAFRYQVAAGTSVNWTPGEYSWSLVVFKTGLRVTVEEGTATVLPNPEAAASYDSRTEAERALADAKAALASFNATGGRVKSYQIAGRAMEFESADGVRSLVSYWTNEVLAERRRKSIDSGQGDPFKAYARL